MVLEGHKASPRAGHDATMPERVPATRMTPMMSSRTSGRAARCISEWLPSF